MSARDVRVKICGCMRAADAIAVAPDDGAEIRGALQIIIERIEAQHDVTNLAVAIRRRHRGDDRAVGDGLDGHAGAVGQCECLDRGAVRQGSVRSARDRCLGCGQSGSCREHCRASHWREQADRQVHGNPLGRGAGGSKAVGGD